HYDKEYEKYYSKLLNIKTSIPRRDDKVIFHNQNFEKGKKNKNTVLKEFKNSFLFGVLGSLIIGSLVLVCKNSQSDFGENIYKHMKQIIATDFYYKNLELTKEKEVKSVNVVVNKEKLQSEELLPFNDFIVVKKSKNDLLKESTVIISEGTDSKIMELANEKGLIINSNNKAVKCVLDGVVSKIDKHKKLGREIVVNHGEGVSTRYINVKDEKIKVGDSVKADSVIAYSLENKEENFKGVIFQVLIDGVIQDINNYSNFINN
ncbi:MAG: M23 family metallopeptidase, partial [Sarcina sp.]